MKPKYKKYKLKDIMSLENIPISSGKQEVLDTPSCPPVYIEIPENSIQMQQFQINHPHMYNVLHRELWKNYGGFREE